MALPASGLPGNPLEGPGGHGRDRRGLPGPVGPKARPWAGDRGPRRRERARWQARRRSLRHPRRGRDRRSLRRRHRAARDARRAREQRRRQLPRSRRGHESERLEDRDRHRAERHFLLLPRVRPPPYRGGHSGQHREHRRRLRLDGRSGLRPLLGGEGRREEHDRDPRGRVGSLRHPGERPRPRPLPPRRHDRGHPGGARAPPAGGPSPGLRRHRWAPTSDPIFPCERSRVRDRAVPSPGREPLKSSPAPRTTRAGTRSPRWPWRDRSRWCSPAACRSTASTRTSTGR